MWTTIRHDEEWITIAQLDEHNQIYFTREFQDLMGDLGWEAKALIGHLLGLWYDPFEHLLDYTSGEAIHTPDQPGLFECNGLDEPQDVVEYWAESWSQQDFADQPAHKAGIVLDLGIEWYRDVLRAKLVSLRLPRRLLIDYKEKLLGSLNEEFDEAGV
jgi:hypothetical protein